MNVNTERSTSTVSTRLTNGIAAASPVNMKPAALNRRPAASTVRVAGYPDERLLRKLE